VQAATSVGLSVFVEDFSESPNIYPGIPSDYLDATGNVSVEDVNFDILSGIYDPTEESLIQYGPFDLGLRFESLKDNKKLFGFGIDSSTSGNKIAFKDADGFITQYNFIDHIGFVGIIATSYIIPFDYYSVSIDSFPPTSIDNLSIAVEIVPKQITINIDPDSVENDINLRSNGLITVAILTDNDFDAISQINPETVRFGPDNATMVHPQVHVEDSDGDGDEDLSFHFRIQDTGIECEDIEATLTGETWDETLVAGTDIIRTIGCKVQYD
jgi:hypothetical protein